MDWSKVSSVRWLAVTFIMLEKNNAYFYFMCVIMTRPKCAHKSKINFSKDKLISYPGKSFFSRRDKIICKQSCAYILSLPLKQWNTAYKRSTRFSSHLDFSGYVIIRNTLFLLLTCFVAQRVRNENGCGSFFSFLMLVRVDILSRVRI